MLHFHDGVSDFPHGAGPSDSGWYFYPDGVISPEPLGPFPTSLAARSAGYHFAELRRSASH
jgi:hypothetical protein